MYGDGGVFALRVKGVTSLNVILSGSYSLLEHPFTFLLYTRCRVCLRDAALANLRTLLQLYLYIIKLLYHTNVPSNPASKIFLLSALSKRIRREREVEKKQTTSLPDSGRKHVARTQQNIWHSNVKPQIQPLPNTGNCLPAFRVFLSASQHRDT